MTDRDEESVLSNSYSDCHSVTVDSSTMWGKPTVRISERESKPQTTEHKDRDSHKSSDRDRNKNCKRDRDRSKMSDNQCMLQNGLVGIPHDAETMKVIAPVIANVRDHVGRRVHPTATKLSRDAEEAPVHHADRKKSRTPEG